MAYRHGRQSNRKAYEECFQGIDGREVTFHRVVNIVGKRSSMPQPWLEHDRVFNDDELYGGPQYYQDARECHEEGSYPPSDRRYYDENPNFGHFRRNSSPPQNEGPYSQQCYKRDDLRHQLSSRNSGRTGPYFRSRGRGSGPPVRENHKDYKISPSVAVKRDRSPGGRETEPPVHSGSNTSNRSFSPDRDKGHNHQQAQKKHKPNVLMDHTPSREGSPHSSGSSKEKTPASAGETEEVVAASVEPKLTPEEDFKARRSEAIKAKALEIEKHYRQDCETFRTVVNMLVAKEPSLDNLLQAPLDENLLEIKQRCLNTLRHFVKELDETITRKGDGTDHASSHTSSTINIGVEEDFPQLCSTNPTITDKKQEGEKQPGCAGDSTPVPVGNQGGEKQTGNAEDSVPTPEIPRPGKQENMATPGPEDSRSKPKELLSKSLPAPAQQGTVEVLQPRLQLYSQQGEKFRDNMLLNPNAWKDITYARPGRVPEHLPFLHPGDRYWELKANSTVVSTFTPPYRKGQKKVACGVTCYNHNEGPWCEVQSQDGTRICILVAPPQTAGSHL